MKIYRCRICGFIYDEVAAGKPFSTLRACPVCQAALTQFEATDAPHTEAQPAASDTLAYAAQYARTDEAEPQSRRASPWFRWRSTRARMKQSGTWKPSMLWLPAENPRSTPWVSAN